MRTNERKRESAVKFGQCEAGANGLSCRLVDFPLSCGLSASLLVTAAASSAELAEGGGMRSANASESESGKWKTSDSIDFLRSFRFTLSESSGIVEPRERLFRYLPEQLYLLWIMTERKDVTFGMEFCNFQKSPSNIDSTLEWRLVRSGAYYKH